MQLGDPERVAGFVAPGSDVTIFATVSGGTDGASEFTQVLLPEVQVIGVGTTTVTTQTTTTEGGEQTTEEVPRTVLTLAVDQQEAQRIISAQTVGELYFGLRGADAKVNAGAPDQPTEPVPLMTAILDYDPERGGDAALGARCRRGGAPDAGRAPSPPRHAPR